MTLAVAMPAQAQGEAGIGALNAQVAQLEKDGKFAQAIPLAEHAWRLPSAPLARIIPTR